MSAQQQYEISSFDPKITCDAYTYFRIHLASPDCVLDLRMTRITLEMLSTAITNALKEKPCLNPHPHYHYMTIL